ncbi:DUF397 domain-containing protein [Nonomuraea sp. 3N208]|uniref:DUF397 domain-containing protein n=1 Tax=Nonomuraea sp. 3N208 TaxID=3457421 RepID=UPI003FD3704E
MEHQWKRSSFCSHNGNCLEVRLLDSGDVAIRDSKDVSLQPLVISASSYRHLLDKIKRGDV